MAKLSTLIKPIVYLLPVTLLLLHVNAYAQYDQLLHKTYAQRAGNIKQIYDRVIAEPDGTAALKMIDDFTTFAVGSGDKELVLEAKLLTAYYLSKGKAAHAQVIADFESIIAEARQQGVAQITARALDVLGKYYWYEVGNYELAFEKYFELIQVLATIADEAFPDKMASMRTIGYAYYYFGDYREAIQYLRGAAEINITAFNRTIHFDVLNTIGLGYQKLGNLDSADFFFRQVIDGVGTTTTDTAWQNIARGNLGYNYFLQKKYKEAIPLLQADIDGAIATRDWGLAAGSLVPLATIYFGQGNFARANALAQQAVDYVKRSGQYNRHQTLYPLLAKLAAARGEPGLAARYIDSASFVKDSPARQFNALQLLRAHQKVERQQQRVLQDNIAYQKSLKTIERNALLAIVLLLISLLLYMYYSTHHKLRQQQELKALQLQEKERELQQAAEQLQTFRQSIQKKNELIENLQQQFDTTESNGILQELWQSTILTDKDWEKFRSLFEQVHTGYLNRLRLRFPHLTPAETRYMVLCRLGFSNKEMAAALSVSSQNIRTIWYRIRKKHNLPEEAGQEELAGSI